MQRKLMPLAVACFFMASAVATAQKQPKMPSIIIDQAAATLKKPLSESERDYWRCVLKNLKNTHSDDAVDVILAACRALYGVN